jgi:hypothetical protein
LYPGHLAGIFCVKKTLLMKKYLLMLGLLLAVPALVFAQVEEDEDDEDYDLYGEATYVGEKAKSYANAKINGLSPQRFVSVGYDIQFPYSVNFSEVGSFPVDQRPDNYAETGTATYTGAYRLNANIPVISTNKFLWQMGANYLQTDYVIDAEIDGTQNVAGGNGLSDILTQNSLRTMGLFTTIYKPLNETHFLLFQASADLNGNFGFSNIQSLDYLRYSAAALWGKRPHDRLQWAVGISRTYRVGNMNYIPVLLYNWTSRSGKWGTEILFPARGAVRYTFNSRNMLFFGFDLEGQTYRIQQLSSADNSFEIRRGELRFRFEYQRQLTGFFWLGLQAGVRIDYAYDADDLIGREAKTDIFRGFFGSQEFAMRNKLGPAPFLSMTINFVSP